MIDCHEIVELRGCINLYIFATILSMLLIWDACVLGVINSGIMIFLLSM